MTSKGYRDFGVGVVKENVLKLDCGDVCMTMNILKKKSLNCTLKGEFHGM